MESKNIVEVEMLVVVLILVVLTIIFVRKCCRKRSQDTRSERQPLLEEDYEFHTDVYLPGLLVRAQSQSSTEGSLKNLYKAQSQSSTEGSLKNLYKAKSQSSTEGSLKNSDKLVKILVKKFKTQRQSQKSEFAVLFLLPSLHLSDWIQTIGTEHYETNNKYHSVPNTDDALTNYITARPGGNCDAEVNILNRLDQLMSQYELKNFPYFKTILLYTWLPPCKNCTQAIKKNLGHYASTHRVVVIYTVEFNHNAASDYRELQKMGIEVQRVIYHHYLPTQS